MFMTKPVQHTLDWEKEIQNKESSIILPIEF